MALSYPLSFPATKAAARVTFRAKSVVGISRSPFSLSQQSYAFQGMCFEADVQCPRMLASDAEAWISGLLLALNGREGTFYMGPNNAGYTGALGTWNGASPLCNGAQAAQLRTLAVKSAGASATWKMGDWLQLGTGSSSRLHKVVKDGAADGSGNGSLEIWPATRAAVANGDAIVIANPLGVWRLASNVREWSVEEAMLYGVSFSAEEAL